MAIEALYQTAQSNRHIDAKEPIFNVSYRLRNVKFSKAMILQDDFDQKIQTSLIPSESPRESWSEFKISSFKEGVWSENCEGSIRIVENTKRSKSTLFEMGPLIK
jgi:hypothetical protein